MPDGYIEVAAVNEWGICCHFRCVTFSLMDGWWWILCICNLHLGSLVTRCRHISIWYCTITIWSARLLIVVFQHNCDVSLHLVIVVARREWLVKIWLQAAVKDILAMKFVYDLWDISLKVYQKWNIASLSSIFWNMRKQIFRFGKKTDRHWCL